MNMPASQQPNPVPRTSQAIDRKPNGGLTPAAKVPVPLRKYVLGVTVEGIKSKLSQRYTKELSKLQPKEAKKQGLDVFSCSFGERFPDDSDRTIFLTGDGENSIRGVEVLVVTFPNSKRDPRNMMIEPLKVVLSSLSPSLLTTETEKWVEKSVREGVREVAREEGDFTFRVFNNKTSSTVTIYPR